MNDRPLPTPDEMRRVVDYDPETGAMFWRPRAPESFRSVAASEAWHKQYCGKPAFNGPLASGHHQGAYLGHRLLAHRVAWAIVHGAWPTQHIDHINGVPSDNRIENLRDATRTDNNRNARRSSRNKSGHAGVSWKGAIQKWQANIGAGGRLVYLGIFASKEEAIAARQAAEAKYGYHENHGRSATN